MKTLISIFALALVTLCASCELLGLGDDKPNTLGGDTDVEFNTVGNRISNTTYVGGQYIDTQGEAQVMANNDGVLTIKASAVLPATHALYTFLPDSIKKGGGLISGTFRLKSTSEGLLDYFNKDQKPFTLVKYDAKVGDTYQVTKDDGSTITRKVTSRSTDDDFGYGFMLIKVITVEQDSRIPGVSKIVYKVNHKFGLVYAEMQMEDGTSAGTYFYSQFPAK